MVDIADLDPDIDITVAGPEDYVDNVAPPLPIGTYTLRLKDFVFEPNKTKGKAPVLLLKQVVVAEGPHENRGLGWQRIYATPFTRKNPATGTEEKSSGLADFVRSIDKTYDTASKESMNIEAVKQFLQNAVDNRLTFKAKVDWEGWDKDYDTQLRNERGVPKNDYKSPAAKEIDSLTKFKGKAFAGKPSLVNPNSQNRVDAQIRLSNFYPSRD